MTQLVLVRIERIAFGGDGVGVVVESNPTDEKLLGIKAFIPFSAPGDVVWAEVVEVKSNYLKANITDIQEQSSLREVPPCPYFTVCGGCELQHLKYDAQLVAKRELVQGSLSSAGFSSGIVDLVDSVWGECPFSYRQRLSLHVDAMGQVGFFKNKTNDVVPIDSCAIAVKKISDSLPRIQRFGGVLKGKVNTISLEADEEDVFVVAKSPQVLLNEDRQSIISQAQKEFPNFILVEKGQERYSHGEKYLKFAVSNEKEVAVSFPAGSFSQVNWGVNRQLIAAVVGEASRLKGQEVLDLYAGAGNFSFPLALAGKNVIAVECDSNLVKLGQENMRAVGLEKKIKIIKSSVEEFLKNKIGRQYDLLILDPPRSGVGKIVDKLPSAKKLILISCHLPSFVTDLKGLIRYGWNPKSIKPFDMFAQTTYLEIMTVLEK